MTDNSNRYGSEPLGRSVEEIEQETGNVTNSPVEGEAVRHAEDTTLVVPAVVNSNTSGIPALVNPDALTDGGGRADDGTTRENRDSSE
ncbi:hypothetical protein [Deinococcus koreensis]|uniref:Uncharacterized protein n=1 Tax=Deinococcus koreensis TaxID=2054903 RepID=A0A2K3UZ68_9DEIO|nr:hypothetical protein [Deinococcus koreensis]PNY81837.1 hypothetical protein CVO96_11030 [Deinococcus koreensis]